MNAEERVRDLLNNIHSWSWDIYPKFEVEREDAEALREVFKNDSRFKGCYFADSKTN